MAAIGGILAFAGIIASFVLWIMIIVKAFKAGDTLWGVLSIFISICALIYAFMNGHTKLGIYMIVAAIVAGVGYGMMMPSIIAQAQEMQQIQVQ